MDDPSAKSEPAARGQLGTILDRRRWRFAIQLGGVGDSAGTLLPLFVVGVLGGDIAIAAGSAAAYTIGSLLGNVTIWGRLADRVRGPRALVILGTATQGGLLMLIGLWPDVMSILAYATILGAMAVSMDSALLRLVAGDLESRARLRAVVQFSVLVERGVLFGLLLLTIALPAFGAFGDEAFALRVAITVVGALILVESLLALSTVARQRAAPRLTRMISDLGSSGAVVIWAGASAPVQRVLRVAPGLRTAEATRSAAPLPESLVLMLGSMFVLHAGFGMQGNLMALFMRRELGLANGTIMAVFLLGSFLTSVAVTRVAGWLDSVPSVQVQVGAAAVRVVLFGLYALMALASGAVAIVVLIVPLYAVSQLAWGATIPATARRFADMSPASRRGEVAALQSASIGSGAALGAVVGGIVAGGIGFPVMFGLAALLTLAGTLLLLRW